ncbi:Apical junction component 1 [Nymphon striatum]|nr:Apical junction component 1 [Nymphon striatum]
MESVTQKPPSSKKYDLKDNDGSILSTLDDYPEKDCDILEQYACDYSCLELEISSPKRDYISCDANKINGESFPYFDDEEFQFLSLRDINYDSLAKNLTPKRECTKNDNDENVPNSEDVEEKNVSSSLPPSDNNPSIVNSPEHSKNIVKCQHPKCKESALVHIAQRTYKTCHYCYTVYCSRHCRKSHWEKHRRQCMFGRVTNLAWHFIDRGWSAILDSPIYVAWQDLLPQEMGADAYVEVRNLCNRYNPETKYILIVAIYVTTQIGSFGLKKTPAAGYEREVLMKCSKMRLIPPTVLNIWQPTQSKASLHGKSSRPFDAKDLLRSYNS